MADMKKMQGIGKKISFGKIKDNSADYQAIGYKGRREFAPRHWVVAGLARAMIGG